MSDHEVLLAYGVASAASICESLWAFESMRMQVPLYVQLEAQQLRDDLIVQWCIGQGRVITSLEDLDTIVVEVRQWLAEHVDELNEVLTRKGALSPYEVLGRSTATSGWPTRLEGGTQES